VLLGFQPRMTVPTVLRDAVAEQLPALRSLFDRANLGSDDCYGPTTWVKTTAFFHGDHLTDPPLEFDRAFGGLDATRAGTVATVWPFGSGSLLIRIPGQQPGLRSVRGRLVRHGHRVADGRFTVDQVTAALRLAGSWQPGNDLSPLLGALDAAQT
jgi:hypothetical protein